MEHVVQRVASMCTEDRRKPEVVHLMMDQPPQHGRKYFASESHQRFSGWSYLM
jgi:hypothetical protein